MANRHFGNLADVFKHVALAEILTHQKPAEYWESHAGSAAYEEPSGIPIPPERLHGVHAFLNLAANNASQHNAYYRQLMRGTSEGRAVKIPGSPSLAMSILGDQVRRFLFCDIEAESLLSICRFAKNIRLADDKLECVQDDGILVLRGAGLTLNDQWTRSALVFIDPYEPDITSDAGISPLELWCELAKRGIAALLFYGFNDDSHRIRLHRLFIQILDKARLLHRNSYGYEGTLAVAPSPELPTLWGFGLLTINLTEQATVAVDNQLHALETAYAAAELPGAATGAWKYSFRRQ